MIKRQDLKVGGKYLSADGKYEREVIHIGQDKVFYKYRMGDSRWQETTWDITGFLNDCSLAPKVKRQIKMIKYINSLGSLVDVTIDSYKPSTAHIKVLEYEIEVETDEN